MLLLPFNSLLAKSYTEGFVISPGVDIAERSEVSPIEEIALPTPLPLLGVCRAAENHQERSSEHLGHRL